jgi:hypothetical protein
MFQTFVSFEPNEGMSFTPDERSVLNELNDNTMEGVVAVAQVGAGSRGTATVKVYASPAC